MPGNKDNTERSQREQTGKGTSYGSTVAKTKVRLPKLKKCDHRNLVPYILNAELMRFHGQDQIIDRNAAIINGQWLRVTKYYCPNCNQFIEPPKE